MLMGRESDAFPGSSPIRQVSAPFLLPADFCGPGPMGQPSCEAVAAQEGLSGRQDSLDRLMPTVYEELRVIARHHLARRDAGTTLSPTGLVHEAYLKLSNGSHSHWRDRAHFFALASVVMRHVLVDRARARVAHKRGGGFVRITLDDDLAAAPDQAELVLLLGDAIDRLAAIEPRLARVVDCRFFGGLSDEEIAAALEVTVRTVQRDWMKARMLLRRALES